MSGFGSIFHALRSTYGHITRVIREDNGSSQLVADRLDGLSQAVLFIERCGFLSFLAGYNIPAIHPSVATGETTLDLSMVPLA